MTGQARSATTTPSDRPRLLDVWCGQVAYEEALALQQRLAAARAAEESADVLLTLEHDRVYTAGPHADVAAHVLGREGVRVVRTDRGGDVTYHGPGQLVAYPIVKLPQPRGVRRYVAALEDACMRAAAHFGVAARSAAASGDPRTGVWVGEAKLVAIGVRVDRGVTSHGLAFNVTTDLDDFTGIVPCGMPDAGVCSLASLGVDATVDDVRGVLALELAAVLDRRLATAHLKDIAAQPGPRSRAAEGAASVGGVGG